MQSMRQALRFTVALVAGLALLTWGASVVVTRTTRAWFERDMLLRAQLAVSGAREALVAHWDQRGGAAPGPRRADPRRARPGGRGLRRRTSPCVPGRSTTPPRSPASASGPRSARVPTPPAAWATWSSVFSVPGGQVHATAVPVATEAPAGVRGPRPRPELRRAAGGHHEALPRAGLRLPRPRRVGRHPRRRAALVAGLEQRAAAAHPGREPAPRVPALPPRRARPGRAPGRRSGRRTAWAGCGRRSGSRTR